MGSVERKKKMIFHQKDCFSIIYDKKFYFIWNIVICLLLVTPVHLFPHPKIENFKNVNQLNASEALNSKIASANAKSNIEKPVFDNSNYGAKRNIESAKSVTNRLEQSAPTSETATAKTTSREARQLHIPFMAVPSNWLATFEPSNAVIITHKAPLRIWAIGSVSRFPAFLERLLQRVQSYYSTYKYPDLSRPASLAIINPQYHQYDTSEVIESAEGVEYDSTEESSTLFDSIENETTEDDLIENDSVESDTVKSESIEDYTDTPATDYYDTTTDPNYSDENEIVRRKCNESIEIN